MQADRCPVCLPCCLSVCLSVRLKVELYWHCGQTVGWIKMKLGMQACIGPGHIMVDGEPDPPSPKGHSPPNFPQFSLHVYFGQTAGWMKTPVGTEVDLGPGHIVLDGVPHPRERGTAPPLFGPCLLWRQSPISATAELVFFVPCSRLVVFLLASHAR